ncbi:DUF6340 family protein [Maribacter sp. CXY002]|uniref:DUF6340 family protein n=1 Tax=Maribacter luteocoastalis TaxID=3407671 RepID=UPI003B6855C2
MRTTYFLFIIVVLLTTISCGSTNRLTLGVTQPARIAVPSEVTKIGIINRSIPSEENNKLDKLDKILSLEGLNLDKEGAEFSINGLLDELIRDDRYEVVKLIDDVEEQRKGLGVFPAALPSESVDRICEENDVDILFSLEFYDTDTAANYELGTVMLPNNLGIRVGIPGHKVTLNTVIKNGWRVYDPLTRSVLDEHIFNDYLTSVGEGINPVKAFEAIAGRKEGVMQISNNVGVAYALQTRPMRIRVARDYFVKGSNNFKIAMRRARTGNWDGAADLWASELDNPKLKIAGRAYYNMAIINEIHGDLDKALEMASVSYSDYENKLALTYVNILRRRIAEQQELEASLNQLSK